MKRIIRIFDFIIIQTSNVAQVLASKFDHWMEQRTRYIKWKLRKLWATFWAGVKLCWSIHIYLHLDKTRVQDSVYPMDAFVVEFSLTSRISHWNLQIYPSMLLFAIWTAAGKFVFLSWAVVFIHKLIVRLIALETSCLDKTTFQGIAFWLSWKIIEIRLIGKFIEILTFNFSEIWFHGKCILKIKNANWRFHRSRY